MKPLLHEPNTSCFKRYVVDLETRGLGEPGKPPRERLAELYDGRKFFEARTMRGVLEELFERGEDFELWAHYGGGFDYRFVLDWLYRTRKVRSRITNVGSIILSVDGSHAGVHFRLLDSIRLLPAKLKDIGVALGLLKVSVADSEWEHIGMRRLRKRCRRDCKILWEALKHVELNLESRGVGLRTTLASAASASIRAKLDSNTVATCCGDPEHSDNRSCSIESMIEPALFGGRVEVFQEYCFGGNFYDIRSSYPTSMLGPIPWRFVGEFRQWRESALGAVAAKVTVPDDYLTVLPWRCPKGRDKGRIFFPSGTWRGVFIGEELRRAVECGAKIERVYWHMVYDGSEVLREFALNAWHKRQTAKGFERFFWKIFLNAGGYGKLVERELKQALESYPESVEGTTMLSKHHGIRARYITYRPAFRHTIAGATITARSRLALFDRFQMIRQMGGQLYYTDTDSIVTDVELPTSENLGELELQAKIRRARFVSPKLYCYQDLEDKWHVKAKGYPKLRNNPLDVDVIAEGWGIQMYRTSGIRESLRHGNVGYQRLALWKHNRNPRPKRADGGTRPWTITELMS